MYMLQLSSKSTKKLGNFERSLNNQTDILNTGSLEYLPSYALLKS